MAAKIKSLSVNRAQAYKNKPRGLSDRAFEKVYWPYLPLVLVVGALLSFGAQAGAVKAAMRSHNTKVLDYSTSMSLGGLLADSNAARAQNGIGGLSLDKQLDTAAQAQANDMAKRNYWSHNTPEGTPPWTWVTAQGYDYQKLGQNLAAGFGDEQTTVNGWMASPPHRENLLDADYSQVGFGWANNPNYTSASGGPMTIVVAFYGQPTNAVPASASTVTTPNSSTPTAGATQPETTNSPGKGLALSYKTSRAQIAIAHLPQSRLATDFAIVIGCAALGLWISRHLFSLRRVLVYGEKFAIHHPLVDVGLLTIAAISFAMTQTVGFIL